MSPKNLNSIGDLKRDPRNPRKHGERNLQQIEQSLKNFGAGRSIVIDEKNQILAGNGLVEAAENIGLSKMVVVDATGEEIVAVRRSGLTERQKSEYRIADNRSAELAEWDIDTLQAMSEEIDLEQFWNASELEELFRKEFSGDGAGETSGQANKTLAERFLVPPFSVLDARQGYWQDRKRAWLALGIESELGRGGHLD